MFTYLRKQLERCLMDRAFRTLHEKIEDQAAKIKQLESKRENVQSHIGHIEKQADNRIASYKRDHTAIKNELDRQVGINRILKKKRHLEGQRQKAIIQQLRDFAGEENFLKICRDVGGRPDSEFLGDFHGEH